MADYLIIGIAEHLKKRTRRLVFSDFFLSFTYVLFFVLVFVRRYPSSALLLESNLVSLNAKAFFEHFFLSVTLNKKISQNDYPTILIRHHVNVQ